MGGLLISLTVDMMSLKELWIASNSRLTGGEIEELTELSRDERLD